MWPASTRVVPQGPVVMPVGSESVSSCVRTILAARQSSLGRTYCTELRVRDRDLPDCTVGLGHDQVVARQPGDGGLAEVFDEARDRPRGVEFVEFVVAQEDRSVTVAVDAGSYSQPPAMNWIGSSPGCSRMPNTA